MDLRSTGAADSLRQSDPPLALLSGFPSFSWPETKYLASESCGIRTLSFQPS